MKFNISVLALGLLIMIAAAPVRADGNGPSTCEKVTQQCQRQIGALQQARQNPNSAVAAAKLDVLLAQKESSCVSEVAAACGSQGPSCLDGCTTQWIGCSSGAAGDPDIQAICDLQRAACNDTCQ